MKMELEDRKVLEGNDSDDYVAEGWSLHYQNLKKPDFPAFFTAENT